MSRPRPSKAGHPLEHRHVVGDEIGVVAQCSENLAIDPGGVPRLACVAYGEDVSKTSQVVGQVAETRVAIA
jgi:hypothetical protein